MHYDVDKFNEYFANHPDDISIDDIDMARIPRHVSCIMDGNGRWATSRGLGRGEGHKAGIVALQEVITACVRMGVDVLSAYAFSTENWNRPQAEVNLLMHLFAKTFVDELPLLKRENVRVEFLGDISALPKKTRDVFEYGLAETRNHTGMTLALAVNYGARAELARATRLIAEDVRAGVLDPSDTPRRPSLPVCTRPTCPTPSWSFAHPARCVSPIICFGRSHIQSSISRTPIGPISIVGGSCARSHPSKVAIAALGV